MAEEKLETTSADTAVKPAAEAAGGKEAVKPAARVRGKKKKAVKMVSFKLSAFGKQTMTLAFASDSWAEAFAAANAGRIVRSS